MLQTIEKNFEKTAQLAKQLKEKQQELDESCLKKYEQLSEAEVKHLVIEQKWMQTLQGSIQREIDSISQSLTTRIKELGERYDETLGTLDSTAKELEEKVKTHLTKMGLVWSK
jgi:type I restriction enzyme M protein